MDGRCYGLGRPFCSHFSAVGDVRHFHFAQGYRLDVMYFVTNSESDTHDGESITIIISLVNQCVFLLLDLKNISQLY